ncbi:hypothetical protein Trco_002909 [Trichoderma cornu-damae]|uniref:Uncharacterized protein n=1 Tax=Trichoderma cornu-damae TaxID=654480 RepID=A0A9P8TYG2_9HYPO|nr:hypothetical protein Trco_002909 [Trichoderma cornu-damae]
MAVEVTHTSRGKSRAGRHGTGQCVAGGDEDLSARDFVVIAVTGDLSGSKIVTAWNRSWKRAATASLAAISTTYYINDSEPLSLSAAIQHALHREVSFELDVPWLPSPSPQLSAPYRLPGAVFVHLGYLDHCRAHPSQGNANNGFSFSDICKIILAIILPPIGVLLERGCGADLLINILLTILGYIPGIIHALYIILKY